MSHDTTMRIKAFAKDREEQDSLLALMDFYEVNALSCITEEMGLAFLSKLENGEITIN